MGKGGKGKGGGGWIFIPAGGFGGGWGGGKGKGRGKNNIGMVRRTAKDKPEKCVWIGGLKETGSKDKELNKKLQAFINKKVEGCKFVDIGPRGSGGAIFGTEEEAANCISELNGQKFMGKTLELDVYVKGWKGDD